MSPVRSIWPSCLVLGVAPIAEARQHISCDLDRVAAAGQITVDHPQLVQSNTAVEDPVLNSISLDMMHHLRNFGWECAVVEPRINEKLYNRILRTR